MTHSTKARICPNCGRCNPHEAWNCVDCGGTLSIKSIAEIDSYFSIHIPTLVRNLQSDIESKKLLGIKKAIDFNIKNEEIHEYLEKIAWFDINPLVQEEAKQAISKLGYELPEEKHPEPDIQHQHGSILGEITTDEDYAEKTVVTLSTIIWLVLEIMMCWIFLSQCVVS